MGGWRDNGKTVTGSSEIFTPLGSKSSKCSVGNLNVARTGHSMCNNIVCGGTKERTCEKFDGTSTFTLLRVKLTGARWSHSCWGLKSGDILLFGGYTDEYWKYDFDGDSDSAEKVSADGSSSKIAFKFDYHIT